MASNQKSWKPTKAAIEQFCTVTGASKDVAKQVLEVCQGNMEMAVNMFLEEQEAGGGGGGGGGGDSGSVGVGSGASSSHVRDPIPPRQGVLVEGPTFQGYPTRTKRAVHSVFDSFRDFQVETRRQEEMMSGSQASSKKRSLEDLFRPPLDLVFHGTFQNARDAGVAHQKWLMVNVQNVMEFSCQILNRDIWSNKAIKTVIREHFIFWQVYLDSAEGQRYAAFYNVSDWPYVAVIDPRTGESLKVWNRIESSSFCDSLIEFLCQQQSMQQYQNPMKRAKLSSSPLTAEDAPNGSAVDVYVPERPPSAETADTTASSDSAITGLLSKPSTSRDMPSLHGSESPKATTSASSLPDKDLCASKSNSLVDAKEDIQIAAAIQASLVSNGRDAAGDKKPVSERADSSSSNAASHPGVESPSSSDEGEEAWKSYLGQGDDVEMSFLIRYPDETREQLVVPVSAQIKALTKYVASKGYPQKEYEMVLHFPRRVLSDMDGTITVKDLGLHRQETVFVQLR